MTAGRLSLNDRALSAYSATIRKLSAPVEYYTDAKGRTVRKPNIDNPVTWDEQRDFLIGQRVVDEDEVLEVLGLNAFKSMVSTGKLRRDARFSYYWVTNLGAEFFRLPKVMGCSFPA